MNENTQRIDKITPFHVMDILRKAQALEQEGRSVVHLEIGEPDFPTPKRITEAGIRALKTEQTFYTPAAGLPELREAIAGYYKNRLGHDVAANRIFITPGASGALMLSLLMLINPGDEVLIPDPGYPCNRNFVHAVNGIPKLVSCGLEHDFVISNSMLSDNWRPNTKLVMLSSPANPTGKVLSPLQLKDVSDFCVSNKGYLLVDEIYQGLTYESEDFTALSVSDEIIVINSFSKFFGMTGWRLGWAVVPESLIPAAEKLMQNIYIAASTPAQHAAIEAFHPDTLAELDHRRDIFKLRRNTLISGLTELGIRPKHCPEGAFYIYTKSDSLAQDSMALCQSWLSDCGVAVTPGIDFGDNAPEKYIRFAYTIDEADIEKGIDLLLAWKLKNTA